MFSPVNYPIYSSYVYQHEQYAIFTQQTMEWNGDLSLFSTIVTPGQPTKHCWTSGITYGCEYRIRTEYSDPNQPGRAHVYHSSIFHPAFAYQLAVLCPDTTASFDPRGVSEFSSSLCPPTPIIGPIPLPDGLPVCPPSPDRTRESSLFIPCGVSDAFSGPPTNASALPLPVSPDPSNRVHRTNNRGCQRRPQAVSGPSSGDGRSRRR